MNLGKIRLERGWTVQQLADICKMPKRTIEDILRRDDCRVSTALKIADALGVTLDELCRMKNE